MRSVVDEIDILPHLTYTEQKKINSILDSNALLYDPFSLSTSMSIGMRFALIEMKILLVRLLREYSILPGEHLESKFNIRERTVIAPEEVWVKLVKRSA